MKVLLTGITGNLGFEIARSLNKYGVDILPVVRNLGSLNALGLYFERAIEADLTKEVPNITSGQIDCIVHSAGNVHFKRSLGSNSRMMLSVIAVAKKLEVPIYYVSTAFLWREPGNNEKPRNVYEYDKYSSENLLQNSGVAHTIFRPSVLTGHSELGKLINWTGYYMLASKFLEAVNNANASEIRFPKLIGSSNMVPVDQAAEVIAETVINSKLNKFLYITNPEPPSAQWVLNTTLNYFGIEDRFEFLDISFADYENYQRSSNEEMLYLAGKHFGPYWSLTYNFPESVCKENLITNEYLRKTLGLFQNLNKSEIV